MSEAYDITYDGVAIGKAKVEKQGLYYRFSCRCSLPDEGLYRIHVCGDSRTDLGICVPVDGVFGMDKRLPAKQFGLDIFCFELVPKDWTPREPEIEPQPEELIEDAAEEVSEEETEEYTEENQNEGRFIPVSAEEPFEHLDELDDAVMEMRDGEVGILLPNEE